MDLQPFALSLVRTCCKMALDLSLHGVFRRKIGQDFSKFVKDLNAWQLNSAVSLAWLLSSN